MATLLPLLKIVGRETDPEHAGMTYTYRMIRLGENAYLVCGPKFSDETHGSVTQEKTGMWVVGKLPASRHALRYYSAEEAGRELIHSKYSSVEFGS